MRNKFLIVTALHGREAIAGIVLGYYAGLKKKHPGKIDLLCVVSTEEERILADTHAWSSVYSENKPVTQKFNALWGAAHAHEFDLLLLTGSDDLISESLICFYDKSCSRNDRHISGLKDLYFFNTIGSEAIYFPGYPSPKTIGAGRCFPRYVCEAMSWRPWRNERMNRGLDSICSMNLKRLKLGEVVYTMQQTGAVVVDIKGDESLTPYERVKALSVPAHIEVLTRAFGDTFARVLKIHKEAHIA